MRNAVLVLLVGAVVVAALFLCGYTFGYRSGRNDAEAAIETRTDTLYIYRTERVVEPKYVSRRVVERDTIKVYIRDTVRDSILIRLPREQVVYEDTSYHAVVSGYMPRLDTLEIYHQDRVVNVTNTVSPRKWGFGVSAGVGAIYSFQGHGFDTGIGLMIGAYYKF